jgi:ribonucleoside-diphosphate reductase beta chain
LTESERSAIKNTMLAISQIEVAVKSFWGDLYHRIPKPEIGSVGSTFA